MGKGKTIDSFFNKRRVECDENELVVPGSEEHNVHVQPPLLLLEFEQQSHEEQVHQTQTNDVIFRGIESLERDPALRPQISQYSVVLDLLSPSATLIPANKFRSFKVDDICEMVKKYYPADFTQQEIYGLEQQLKHFVVDASNDKELESVSTLTKLCRFLVETGRHSIYNLIDRLLRLLVTLPVSTASAERAFSALKIVKTRLRNKMEDDFLANSLLVNIEREIAEKYSYDDVLEHFTGAKRRRAEL